MGQDEEILKDCLAGRPGAWEAFAARFGPGLSATCRRALRRCGRPSGDQEAADAVQELFAYLLSGDMKALRAYRGEAPLAGFLSVLAVYRILKARPPPASAELPEAVDPSPGPSQIAEAGERREAMEREMARLDPKARLVLTLHAEGAPVREAAAALGISEDAAFRLIAKAKAALRLRIRK